LLAVVEQINEKSADNQPLGPAYGEGRYVALVRRVQPEQEEVREYKNEKHEDRRPEGVVVRKDILAVDRKND
jgi:hypothetical protein